MELLPMRIALWLVPLLFVLRALFLKQRSQSIWGWLQVSISQAIIAVAIVGDVGGHTRRSAGLIVYAGVIAANMLATVVIDWWLARAGDRFTLESKWEIRMIAGLMVTLAATMIGTESMSR